MTEELELLKELAAKHNYYLIPNHNVESKCVLSKHSILEIAELLEYEDLQVDFSFDIGDYFDTRAAMIYLLLQEVIFINDYSRELDSGEKIKHASLLLNSSDIFAWGYADAEEITTKDIKSIYEHVIKDPEYGYKIWTIKKYNRMPQKALYERIKARGIWNLDEMDLEPND